MLERLRSPAELMKQWRWKSLASLRRYEQVFGGLSEQQQKSALAASKEDNIVFAAEVTRPTCKFVKLFMASF